MTIRATKNLSWDEWLTAWWGTSAHSRKPDLQFSGPRRSDMRLAYIAFCAKGYDEHGGITVPSLVEELEARGYDISTLEFRVKRKVVPDGQ